MALAIPNPTTRSRRRVPDEPSKERTRVPRFMTVSLEYLIHFVPHERMSDQRSQPSPLNAGPCEIVRYRSHYLDSVGLPPREVKRKRQRCCATMLRVCAAVTSVTHLGASWIAAFVVGIVGS